VGEPLVWAEIDLDAIARNTRALKAAAAGSRLMAVVKADGYGHGAVPVARTALAAGAEALGVARLHEALALRRAGLTAPVLVFGHTPVDLAGEAVAHRLTLTVSSLPEAVRLSEAALDQGRPIPVHLKVDTGMGRMGLLPDDLKCPPGGRCQKDRALQDVGAIAALQGLALEGIYTHFAAADEADKSYTASQLARLTDFVGRVKQMGIAPRTVHAANSAGIIDLPDTHLDMVRAGISLYGLYPSKSVDRRRVALVPAMRLKARVVHVKAVPAGFNVSYGMTWTAPRPTTIATVAVGYADGYSRRLSSQGFALIRGRRVPLVGRVCMDLTMFDVGAVPEVAVGDEAVLLGRQGEAEIPADELAGILGTINYEVVAALTTRVERVYRDGGRPAGA
jgi:alanine racemase